MDNSNVNIDLIRGHVDTIIMRSIFERDKYGLEILNEITSKSNGLYSLKISTIYSCLKRLEKQGYVRSVKGDASNGAPRVYYSLTQEGKEFLLNDQYQWEYSRTIINNLLSDKEFDATQEVPFEASDLRPLTRRQNQTSDEITTQTADIAPNGENDGVDELQDETYSAPTTNTAQDDTRSQYNFADIYSKIPREQQDSENSQSEMPNYYNSSLFSKSDKQNFANTNKNSNSAGPNSTIFYRTNKVEQRSNNLFDFKQKQPIAQNYEFIQENNSQNDATLPAYSNSNVTNDEYKTSYIDSFSAIYKNSNSKQSEQEQKASETSAYDGGYSFNYSSLNEMKVNLEKDGFTLKPYIKRNSTEYYSGKYCYKNKLFLLATVVFYISFAIEMIAIFFALKSGATPLPTAFFATMLAVVALLPAFALAKFLRFPNQKSLARFNVKVAMINALTLIINLLAIILFVAYFAFNADFSNYSTLILPVMIPACLLLNIPLFLFIYDGIYKSKLMHIR
ncbi:MAG: PadR family transcriptional regulator [Clostridia bacterium]